MSDGIAFTICIESGVLTFLNRTPYKLYVSSKPSKSKRKSYLHFVVEPFSCRQTESTIDLSALMFSLEKVD